VKIGDDLWTNHAPCHQPHASFFAPNADVLVSIEMLLSLLGDWEVWRSGKQVQKTLLDSKSPKLQGAKAISQPFIFTPVHNSTTSCLLRFSALSSHFSDQKHTHPTQFARSEIPIIHFTA
jgi:hypothetical protein